MGEIETTKHSVEKTRSGDIRDVASGSIIVQQVNASNPDEFATNWVDAFAYEHH